MKRGSWAYGAAPFAASFARLFACGAALCLAACFTSGGDDPPVVDLFPLAVGNTWMYVDSSIYAPDSVVTGTSEINIAGIRSVLAGAESVTVHLLNVKNVFTGEPGPLNVYVRNIGHSNYTYGAEEEGRAFVDITPHLRWPAKAGEEYFTHFVGFNTVNGERVPALDTIKIVVVNPDSTCIVPAGSFRCIHYRGFRLDGAVHADAFYAPGVGSLGNETRRILQVDDSLRTVRFVKKLTSYTLH